MLLLGYLWLYFFIFILLLLLKRIIIYNNKDTHILEFFDTILYESKLKIDIL